MVQIYLGYLRSVYPQGTDSEILILTSKVAKDLHLWENKWRSMTLQIVCLITFHVLKYLDLIKSNKDFSFIHYRCSLVPFLRQSKLVLLKYLVTHFHNGNVLS